MDEGIIKDIRKTFRLKKKKKKQRKLSNQRQNK